MSRSLFYLLSSVCLILVSAVMAQDRAGGRNTAAKPLVISAKDGDILVAHNNTVVVQHKVGSRSGAVKLAAGTVTFSAGAVVPTHLHEIDEELIYVLEGELTVTLNGVDHRAASGDTVFIPPGTWMAIANHTTKPAKAFGVIPRAEVEECFRALFGDPKNLQELKPEELHALCRLRSPESKARPH